MSRRLSIDLAATAAMMVLTAIAFASEPPQIRNNPFARPPSQVAADAREMVLADGSSRELDLRVTMVGSRGGLANVAGRVMRPGDEINGYILVKVLEDRAVFERDGRRLTLRVKPDPESDDE